MSAPDTPPPPPPVSLHQGRRAARDSAALTAGTALSLLAAYGYVVVGTRYLGADRFAPISVVWTFWALTTAVLTFPVQHWITRTIRADGSEARTRRAMPTIWWMTLTLSGVCILLAGLLRHSLFNRGDFLFPMLSGLVALGSVAMGVVRGVLAGRERFVAAGASIAGENLVRLTGALCVVVLGGGQVLFGVMLVAGFAIGFCWLPAFRLADGATSQGSASPLAFLAGVGGGAFLSQLVLYGAPVALALRGGAPHQVTSMFAVMALCRVPYAVTFGLTTQLTGTLTSYVVQGHEDRLRRVRLLTIAGSVAGAAVAATAGASVLEPVVRLVFGPETRLPGNVLAVLGAASAVAVGTLVYTIVLVARARSGAVALAWAMALAVSLGSIAVLPQVPVNRVAWAFLGGEVVALTAMVLLDRTRHWHADQT